MTLVTFIAKLREKGFTPILQDPTKFSSSLVYPVNDRWATRRIWWNDVTTGLPKKNGIWKIMIVILEYENVYIYI